MTPEERLLQIEGQIQALCQAWLRLAAASEMAGTHDPAGLEHSLRQMEWNGCAWQRYALSTVDQLLHDLDVARENRKQQR